MSQVHFFFFIFYLIHECLGFIFSSLSSTFFFSCILFCSCGVTVLHYSFPYVSVLVFCLFSTQLSLFDLSIHPYSSSISSFVLLHPPPIPVFTRSPLLVLSTHLYSSYIYSISSFVLFRLFPFACISTILPFYTVRKKK